MNLPKLPQFDSEKARKILHEHGVTAKVALIGFRGYFTTPGNKRGVYDDLMLIVSPDGVWEYNANTDPSVNRTGIAVLEPGVWRYKKGIHPLSRPGGYPAFRQAAKVTVRRDGKGLDTGDFGINIHKGGHNTTSSEGCQTIYPDQWPQFQQKAYNLMTIHGQDEIPYVLVSV